MSRFIEVKEKFVWLENVQSSVCEKVNLLSGDGASVSVPFSLLVASSDLMQNMLSPCCHNYSDITRIHLPSTTGCTLEMFSQILINGETEKLPGDIDFWLDNLEELMKILGCKGKIVTRLNRNISYDQIQIGKVESLANASEVKREFANHLEEAVISISDEDIVERMETDRASSPDLHEHKLKKCDVIVKKVKHNSTSWNVKKSSNKGNKGTIQNSVKRNLFQSSSGKNEKWSEASICNFDNRISVSKNMLQSSATQIVKDPNLPPNWLVKYTSRPELNRTDREFISPDKKRFRSLVKMLDYLSESKQYAPDEIDRVKEYFKKPRVSVEHLKSLKLNNMKIMKKSSSSKNDYQTDASKKVKMSHASKNVTKFNASKNVIKSKARRNVIKSNVSNDQSNANKHVKKSSVSMSMNQSSASKDANQNADINGLSKETGSNTPIPRQCYSNLNMVNKMSTPLIKDLPRLMKDDLANQSIENNPSCFNAYTVDEVGGEDEAGKIVESEDVQTHQFM